MHKLSLGAVRDQADALESCGEALAARDGAGVGVATGYTVAADWGAVGGSVGAAVPQARASAGDAKSLSCGHNPFPKSQTGSIIWKKVAWNSRELGVSREWCSKSYRREAIRLATIHFLKMARNFEPF